jgi:hypothetical protein
LRNHFDGFIGFCKGQHIPIRQFPGGVPPANHATCLLLSV